MWKARSDQLKGLSHWRSPDLTHLKTGIGSCIGMRVWVCSAHTRPHLCHMSMPTSLMLPWHALVVVRARVRMSLLWCLSESSTGISFRLKSESGHHPACQCYTRQWATLSTWATIQCVQHDKHVEQSIGGGLDKDITAHISLDIWVRQVLDWDLVHQAHLHPVRTKHCDTDTKTDFMPGSATSAWHPQLLSRTGRYQMTHPNTRYSCTSRPPVLPSASALCFNPALFIVMPQSYFSC